MSGYTTCGSAISPTRATCSRARAARPTRCGSRLEDAAERLSTPDDLSVDELALRAAEVRLLVDARLRAEQQVRVRAAQAEEKQREAHVAARDVRTMEQVRDRARAARERALAGAEQQTTEDSVLAARVRGAGR